MTATKRKLLYAMVLLLFLLVITIIGWLAYSLFTLRVVPPSPSPEPEPVVTIRHQQSREGPFSETVINVAALPEAVTGKPGQDASPPDVAVDDGTVGHIPFVCQGYESQISGRTAFTNPVTHQTVVSATRAVVTLTLPPSIPRGDQ
jgi:hypothetical protein